MLRASQILIRSFALALSAASLLACGQRGPLYLPTAPEAAQRATLPQTLRPPIFDDAPEAPAAGAPAAGAPAAGAPAAGAPVNVSPQPANAR